MTRLLELSPRTLVALGFSPGQSAVTDVLAARRAFALARGDGIVVDEHNCELVTFGARLVQLVDALPDHLLDRRHHDRRHADLMARALPSDSHAHAELASAVDRSRREPQGRGDSVATLARDVVAALVEHSRAHDARRAPTRG